MSEILEGIGGTHDQLRLDEDAVCDTCGRFGAFHFGDRALCEDCYALSGSCCCEFGGNDLWAPAAEDGHPRGSDSAAASRNAEGALRLPGAGLSAAKMPGHWLLARLGKRVLRPGGLSLTRQMLEALAIRPSDAVVEFAPGMGVTARMALDLHPASYTGVEDDEAAATRVRGILSGARQRCVVGNAMTTPLPDQSATVVFGEAMLTMQGPEQKHRIVREAARLLRGGGRYGIHELCLVPDDLDGRIKREIEQALSRTIHVGARPLTSAEWRAVLESEGFTVRVEVRCPMRLLEPDRLIQDEGLFGALRFARNLIRDAEARKRVLAMRRIFLKYRTQMAAIMLVGFKTERSR